MIVVNVTLDCLFTNHYARIMFKCKRVRNQALSDDVQTVEKFHDVYYTYVVQLSVARGIIIVVNSEKTEEHPDAG